MSPLAIAGLGTTELLIIFGVIILLFGAAKLPELARGSGRALRIFKSETKGLMDDDDDPDTQKKPIEEPRPIERSPDATEVEPETSRRRDPA